MSIWSPGISPDERARLLDQAQSAEVTVDPSSGMHREVVFQQGHPPRHPLGSMLYLSRRLTEADALLVDRFEPASTDYYLSPQCAPCIGVLAAGELVSVAHSSRRTREACELGIYTRPEARRRGYAVAATAAWTDAVRQEGLQPIYSAFADNIASLRLAATAGYVALIQSVYGPVVGQAE